jgi:pimeloyl-ACP methyl ester carboxylesterase
MNVHDVGNGAPLILVPGIQGRWEWMRPGVNALARRFRVVTFSLCDEPSSGVTFDAARGFDAYVDQIVTVMREHGIERAIVCGVSYGGLIAAAFAARYPDLVSVLVLNSAPPPMWRGNQRTDFYLKAPLLFAPLFALASIRLFGEMRRAYGGVMSGLGHALTHGWNVVTHPGSPLRMARRVRLLEPLDLVNDVARLKTETLIITGEDDLDDVVPPSETRRYLALWPHATSAVLANTGHLGIITRPEEVCRLIEEAVQRSQTQVQRRRIG